MKIVVILMFVVFCAISSSAQVAEPTPGALSPEEIERLEKARKERDRANFSRYVIHQKDFSETVTVIFSVKYEGEDNIPRFQVSADIRRRIPGLLDKADFVSKSRWGKNKPGDWDFARIITDTVEIRVPMAGQTIANSEYNEIKTIDNMAYFSGDLSPGELDQLLLSTTATVSSDVTNVSATPEGVRFMKEFISSEIKERDERLAAKKAAEPLN